MKRFCIIFILLFGMAYSMSAQDITGKWECSKELLDRLQLRYDTMKGHYTFKKNGKFTLRIKGTKTNDFDYSMIQFYNKLYDSDSSQADIQANMIRAEKWFMWSWRDLSVRQTGDSLVIGKIIKLTK